MGKGFAMVEQEILQYKEMIIGSVQVLNNFSRENAANHEEVNENIGRIIAEVRRVNEHCEKMNDVALEMWQSVAYFKR